MIRILNFIIVNYLPPPLEPELFEPLLPEEDPELLEPPLELRLDELRYVLFEVGAGVVLDLC